MTATRAASIATVRARRPSGRLFELTIDRCSGEIVSARPLEPRRFGPYAYGRRRGAGTGSTEARDGVALTQGPRRSRGPFVCTAVAIARMACVICDGALPAAIER